MNVRAKARGFNIFDLFLHDGKTSVMPFDESSLRAWLDKKAEELYPEYHVAFQCPDDTFGSSHWYVCFALNRWDHKMKPDSFPKARLYDEREFRHSIPAELEALLVKLNGLAIEL